MTKSDIGLIGLAVMGQNLVLNMESRGYRVSVYNRSEDTTKKFINERAKNKNIVPAYSLEEFAASIKKPRKIMLMVKAGEAVDTVVQKLVPLLDKDDIVIDGGNSFYRDTIRRTQELKDKGIRYLGTGVSGGEEGALNGPSIMPGGDISAWREVKSILIDISAKVGDGLPCCDYVGPDGAGHYVKMVHNGIEYGDMQLISEAYFLMSEILDMKPADIRDIFIEWNKGELNSYLIEITAHVLGKIDKDTGKPLVDVIMDKAGHKGTGKWTSQEALELGVAAPTIADAVFARFMSSIKKEREDASTILKGPDMIYHEKRDELIKDIAKALYGSKICSYAQGFALMNHASKVYSWDLKLGDIAMMWRGGCIIRARFLDRIKDAYDREETLSNIMLDPYFAEALSKAQTGWRRVVSLAVQMGIPVSSFSSALAYYDAYRRSRLPANLIQAQRDFFGAHTYERIDREGIFHTIWDKA